MQIADAAGAGTEAGVVMLMGYSEARGEAGEAHQDQGERKRKEREREMERERERRGETEKGRSVKYVCI